MAPERKPLLGIVGVYIKTDAYPNVKHKVDGLLADPRWETRELNFAPGATRSFAQRPAGGLFAKLGAAIGFGWAHLRALAAIVRLPAPRAVYVPYPAVFVLYLVSLLPRRWQPARLHADAFISLYDTIVNDRAMLRTTHPLARLLLAVERRAYCQADVVWVDTALNASYMASLFELPAQRFVALPLSIDETIYAPAPYSGTPDECTVLFTGTFVPLQGVDVIARAIALLRGHPGIRFRLIGSGQTAPEVEAFLHDCPNVSWERGWQSAHTLAQEIAAADICLGIFGGGAKAQRVWPYKNYAYMAVGRALISADTPAASALAGNHAAPWVTVPPGRPDLLAAAIVALAADPARRAELARGSAAFFAAHLSSAASLATLSAALAAGAAEQ